MDALQALGGTFCGYKIGATSLEVQQLLSCREPIYAPIRREDVLAAGASFVIPAGLLGVECEYGFLMGQDFPGAGEALTIDALRSCIAGCFMALAHSGRMKYGGFDADALRKAALEVDLPEGGTMLGFGVKFGDEEELASGQNERAFPVIIQYIDDKPYVVWPKSLQTRDPVLPLPASSPYAKR